jgi:hypothetical protein
MHHAVGIRHFRPVNLDRVIMKTFVQRPRVAVPGAVFPFRKLATVPEGASDALGVRRNDAEFNATFRINLWVIFTWLIG